MVYKSPHLEMENIEQKMVAWFMAWLGENQPADDMDLYHELNKRTGETPNLLGFAKMTIRTENEGMCEKVDGKTVLTKKGEGLYIVAKGKKPVNTRFWASLNDEDVPRMSKIIMKALPESFVYRRLRR